MTLHGQTILITGAARRVGRAIALELASRGAALALHYNRSQAEAEALAAEIRQLQAAQNAATAGTAETPTAAIAASTSSIQSAKPVLPPAIFQADLGNCAALPHLIESVAQHFGRLDGLVNNAAVYRRTPLFELTEADWDEHLDINLKAPFFLTRAAATVMRRTGGGLIVNIADSETGCGWPGYLPYGVSKAALASLTKGLAKALAPEIRVNAIGPGTVLPPEDQAAEDPAAADQSSAWEKRSLKKIPLKRFGTPEDVARCVRFLFEEGHYITGELIRIDGGYAA